MTLRMLANSGQRVLMICLLVVTIPVTSSPNRSSQLKHIHRALIRSASGRNSDPKSDIINFYATRPQFLHGVQRYIYVEQGYAGARNVFRGMAPLPPPPVGSDPDGAGPTGGLFGGHYPQAGARRAAPLE